MLAMGLFNNSLFKPVHVILSFSNFLMHSLSLSLMTLELHTEEVTISKYCHFTRYQLITIEVL